MIVHRLLASLVSFRRLMLGQLTIFKVGEILLGAILLGVTVLVCYSYHKPTSGERTLKEPEVSDPLELKVKEWQK